MIYHANPPLHRHTQMCVCLEQLDDICGVAYTGGWHHVGGASVTLEHSGL